MTRNHSIKCHRGRGSSRAIALLLLVVATAIFAATPALAQTSPAPTSTALSNVRVSGPICPAPATVTADFEITNVTTLAALNGSTVEALERLIFVENETGTYLGSATIEKVPGTDNARGSLTVEVPSSALPGTYRLSAAFGNPHIIDGSVSGAGATIEIENLSEGCLDDPVLEIGDISASNPICPDPATITADVTIFPNDIDLGASVSLDANAANADESLRFQGAGSATRQVDGGGLVSYKGQVTVVIPASASAGDWVLTVGGGYLVSDVVVPFGDLKAFSLSAGSTSCVDSAAPTAKIDSIVAVDRICQFQEEVAQIKVTVTASDDVALGSAYFLAESDSGIGVIGEMVDLQGRQATFDIPGGLPLLAGPVGAKENFVVRVFVEDAVGRGTEASQKIEVTTLGTCDGTQPTATPGPTAVPTTTAAPTATPAPPAPTATPAPGKKLAYTGSSTTTLTLFGLGLVAVGIGLARFARRRGSE